MDLYANVRPVATTVPTANAKTTKFSSTPIGGPVDMVIVRENTECLVCVVFTGFEFQKIWVLTSLNNFPIGKRFALNNTRAVHQAGTDIHRCRRSQDRLCRPYDHRTRFQEDRQNGV